MGVGRVCYKHMSANKVPARKDGGVEKNWKICQLRMWTKELENLLSSNQKKMQFQQALAENIGNFINILIF